MEAHFICCDSEDGHRFVLGMNTVTKKVQWMSGWIAGKPMSDWGPVMYKKRELAEWSAKEIGGGAYVYSITINK